MGTTLAELKANLPKDPSLAPVVESTCTMVRDFAVKELMNRNQKAAISLNDLCNGTGFVMLSGAMVSTGGCVRKEANAKGVEGAGVNPGDGTNSFGKTCELREGDIFVKLRKFFGFAGSKVLTTNERIMELNKMGIHNTTGLGAKDLPAPAFLQKQSSNEEIPP